MYQSYSSFGDIHCCYTEAPGAFFSKEVLIADGYEIRDGYASVPDSPGFGLRIDEDAFATAVRVNFELKL